MSLRNDNTTATIICDKCGKEHSEPHGDHNRRFYEAGWTVNFRAKKYVHICYNCKTAKQKKSFDFVKQKFGHDTRPKILL